MRLNDDSNSRRRTLNASRVNLNRVDVRGGQSAREDKSHIYAVFSGANWPIRIFYQVSRTVILYTNDYSTNDYGYQER